MSFDKPNLATCSSCAAEFVYGKTGLRTKLCKPCRISLRNKRARELRELRPGKSAEYNRNYRLKNKEKVLFQAKELRERKPEKHKEYVDKWRAKNAERVKLTRKAYVEKNREVLREKTRQWRSKNFDMDKARTAKWQKENSVYCAISSAKRRAAVLKATPIWANDFFISEAYDLAKRRSSMKCGGHSKWHVDHIVPLKSDLVCGLHVEHNLQIIPHALNISKNNRWWPDMPT